MKFRYNSAISLALIFILLLAPSFMPVAIGSNDQAHNTYRNGTVCNGSMIKVGINDYGALGVEDQAFNPVGFQYPIGYDYESLALGWWGEGYAVYYGSNAAGFSPDDDAWGTLTGVTPTTHIDLAPFGQIYTSTMFTNDSELQLTFRFLFFTDEKFCIMQSYIKNLGDTPITDGEFKRVCDWDIWMGTENYWGKDDVRHPELNMAVAFVNTTTRSGTVYMGLATCVAPSNWTLNWDGWIGGVLPIPRGMDVYGNGFYQYNLTLDGTSTDTYWDGCAVYQWLGTIAPGETVMFPTIYAAGDTLEELEANAAEAQLWQNYGYEQLPYLNMISTGGSDEMSVVALDTNGNVHVVWINDNGKFLKYAMFDPTGGALIQETTLNPCFMPQEKHNERPSIVVDSQNKVHVVFHGFSLYENITSSNYTSATYLNASEVIYLKFDPYLDDRNGNAADFFTITEIPETIISTNDGVKSRAPNIAIDPLDRLHVCWWEGNNISNLNINYLTMDTTGIFLVSETSVTSGVYCDTDWGEPEIVADSSGNAHIVYCNSTYTLDREIWYTMINGTTSNTLINDTEITIEDGSASVRAFMDIDSQDKIHVMWHDMRFGVAELFYSKLDPRLDDQSGDAADPSVISLVSEKEITAYDGYRSFLNDLAVDPSDNLHIVWVDQREYINQGEGELYYEMLNSIGDPLTPETRITWFENSTAPCAYWTTLGRGPSMAVSAEHVYITFNGYNRSSETSDIYLLIKDVPNQLYLVVRGQTGIFYRLFNSSSMVWDPWLSLNGLTVDAPAATIFQGKMYVAVRGTVDDQIWVTSVNLTSGVQDSWTLLDGATPSAPALVSDDNNLILIVRGNTNIFYRFYNTTSATWDPWLALNGLTADTPAAAIFQGKLVVAVRGTIADQVWVTSVNITTGVQDSWTLLDGAIPSAPALASDGSQNLVMLVRGNTNIFYRFYNTTSSIWDPWQPLQGLTPDAPAAAIYEGMLYNAVRGMNNDQIWVRPVDIGTMAPGAWQLLDGSTPSAPALAS